MFVRLLFAMLLFAVSSAQAADYSVTRKYVYPVLISDEKTNIVASGSGTVIKEGYVLTVAHVVPKSKQIAYINDNGLKPARVIKVDQVNDLALLAADVKCPCASISTANKVIIDDPVYAVGFPMFLDYKIQTLTLGTIQGLYGNSIISTTPTAPGGSGGALFGKENGQYKLFGVIKGLAVIDIGPPMFTVGQQQNWFVLSTRATLVRQFLAGTEAAM